MESPEYKYRLENRLLEITADLRLIDRAILRNMETADIEQLGKAVLEAAEVLQQIKERRLRVRQLLHNKRAKDLVKKS
jgi:hypothetical protein